MKFTPMGEFEELVLLAVAAQHDEAYGVSIKKGIEDHLRKEINISAVHVALKRMTDKGFISPRYGGITNSRGGRRKKYYTITVAGKEMLDRQYAIRTKMYERIPKITFS